ncbi:MAG: hypothetical protein HY075_00190 [Deltaproteobacteria bacterium]|nr:hypothetical protein [Deltaproteobacteria bacterium]
MAAGLRAALLEASTPLLGGDTGSAPSAHFTGVGLGLCDGKPLSRMGMLPGDVLCLTGKMGRGPAWGFRRLVGDRKHVLHENDFRPRARIAAGQALRGHATAAMDTSDGLASTLNTLRELNGVGLELFWDERWLDAKAVKYCRSMGLSPLSLLFGEHGDFQLVASVPAKLVDDVRSHVDDLHVIGRVLPRKQGVRLTTSAGASRPLEIDLVARARKDTLAELTRAFKKLVAYSEKLSERR